jgi:cellulose synthase/poly-beta-1,6-N-acetylglucosamine synthase-like glycosyltransferase
MSLAALVVVGVALAVLAMTGLSLWLGVVLALLRRRRTDDGDAAAGRVDVLVPARGEGAGVLRCVDSVLSQEHDDVHVHVLVGGSDDSSAKALRGREPDPRVTVHELGKEGKAEKLNLALKKTSAPYVALLDADHVADPDWLRRSLAALASRPDCVGVQGERRPLQLRRLGVGVARLLHRDDGGLPA